MKRVPILMLLFFCWLGVSSQSDAQIYKYERMKDGRNWLKIEIIPGHSPPGHRSQVTLSSGHQAIFSVRADSANEKMDFLDALNEISSDEIYDEYDETGPAGWDWFFFWWKNVAVEEDYGVDMLSTSVSLGGFVDILFDDYLIWVDGS